MQRSNIYGSAKPTSPNHRHTTLFTSSSLLQSTHAEFVHLINLAARTLVSLSARSPKKGATASLHEIAEARAPLRIDTGAALDDLDLYIETTLLSDLASMRAHAMRNHLFPRL
jgi:hypothetical protein